MKKLSPFEEDYIIQNLHCKTYAEIGDMLGYSKGTIFNVAKRLRGDGRMYEKGKKQDLAGEVLRLREKGVSCVEIGKRLGISRAYVYFLLKAGI